MDPSTTPDPSARSFRFEPWSTAIVLFFLVVFVVNALLVRFSIQSWTGLITEDAYQKGLAFNQTLEAQQQQKALGWQLTLDHALLVAGKSGPARCFLRDRHNQPLTGATIQGMLFRPVHQGVDQRFTMTESEPGLYAAQLLPPLPGHWEIRLEIGVANNQYKHVQKIELPAASQGE